VKDELQELFAGQTGTLNNQSGKRNGVRKIRPFDGESQSARSFLTAIELQMENDGVVGDERKVMYVGNYLEGKAWNWFEPIARERNQHAREDWSERAKRILTNYVEMKKAMQQAFGDLDERTKAAQELQRLRQVRSVREYITDFQMITSNLDWDEEALMDKFKEGLKSSVRSMMIYFPQEPKDLEELYGRSQKIDREQWNQRTQQGYGQKRNGYGPGRNSYGQGRNQYERRDTRQERDSQKGSRHYPTRDRDEDVMMIGAKVDMEKAKKERLCFNWGRQVIKRNFAEARNQLSKEKALQE
jgi:hypothetical protein